MNAVKPMTTANDCFQPLQSCLPVSSALFLPSCPCVQSSAVAACSTFCSFRLNSSSAQPVPGYMPDVRPLPLVECIKHGSRGGGIRLITFSEQPLQQSHPFIGFPFTLSGNNRNLCRNFLTDLFLFMHQRYDFCIYSSLSFHKVRILSMCELGLLLLNSYNKLSICCFRLRNVRKSCSFHSMKVSHNKERLSISTYISFMSCL